MIKNIVFDFGGVLLDLNPELTYVELSNVMGVKMKTDAIPANIYKVMLGYEKGEINTETFIWNLQKVSSKLTPKADNLINAWNAMLLGWNPARFEFLRNLRKDYRLYLLSNTNELHIKWVLKDLKKNHSIKDFDIQFFDQTFYSHHLKMRKPEVEIFNYLIAETGILAGETLFIDDTMTNIKAAKKAGLKAQWHNPQLEIMDLLGQYLNLI